MVKYARKHKGSRTLKLELERLDMHNWTNVEWIQFSQWIQQTPNLNMPAVQCKDIGHITSECSCKAFNQLSLSRLMFTINVRSQLKNTQARIQNCVRSVTVEKYTNREKSTPHQQQQQQHTKKSPRSGVVLTDYPMINNMHAQADAK